MDHPTGVRPYLANPDPPTEKELAERERWSEIHEQIRTCAPKKKHRMRTILIIHEDGTFREALGPPLPSLYPQIPRDPQDEPESLAEMHEEPETVTVVDEVEPEYEKFAERLLSVEALLSLPAPEWTVEGVLQEAPLSLIWPYAADLGRARSLVTG